MGVALDVEQAFDMEQAFDVERPKDVEQPLIWNRPKDVEQAQRGGTEERSAMLFSAF